ncbi:MAG TPA: GntR family transcriptional regulator, partial [Clostridia bacterium]|nr:GntR family transcriptional regulator [Clostridia bacterium]
MSKKYVALYERLLGEIQTGTYSAGAKLPTEQQIAKAHNISRQTVRQSLKMLEDEGFIRRTQGSGSYVT